MDIAPYDPRTIPNPLLPPCRAGGCEWGAVQEGEEMNNDKKRIDFLESLLTRPVLENKKTAYFKRTDIHIMGPDHCNLYARAEYGSAIEFGGYGASVREMIDDAIEKREANK